MNIKCLSIISCETNNTFFFIFISAIYDTNSIEIYFVNSHNIIFEYNEILFNIFFYVI